MKRNIKKEKKFLKQLQKMEEYFYYQKQSKLLDLNLQINFKIINFNTEYIIRDLKHIIRHK